MGRFLVASTRKRGQSTRQRRQRVCTDSFCVLPFLGRGAETRCSCCRVAGLLVCAGEVGRAAATPPPPGGPQTGSTFADPEGREPRRGTGFPGGHGRGLVLLGLGGKDHGAQRSGPRLWKRSFCASTQDRNKTVSCRCRLRLARAPASGQVRNLRRSRPGRWRPPTHGGRHGGAVKAPGNGSNGSAQTPSVLFPFFKGVRRHRCSCCRGAGLLVCVGGAKAAWATSPGRVWWRFALALAHRATARRTSQAARRAAASGLRRWPIYDNAVYRPQA